MFSCEEEACRSRTASIWYHSDRLRSKNLQVKRVYVNLIQPSKKNQRLIRENQCCKKDQLQKLRLPSIAPWSMIANYKYIQPKCPTTTNAARPVKINAPSLKSSHVAAAPILVLEYVTTDSSSILCWRYLSSISGSPSEPLSNWRAAMVGRVAASDFIRIRWTQREGYAHGTLQCSLKAEL